MSSAEFDRAWRTARWQLWAGWFAAAATLVARLTTVRLQLSRGYLNVADFGLAVLKSGLLIAVGLLVGVAFFLGARGARQLHALRAAERAAAPSV